jgi:hypothetical protein
VMTGESDWMRRAKHLPALRLSLSSVVTLNRLRSSSRSLERRTEEMDSFQSS